MEKLIWLVDDSELFGFVVGKYAEQFPQVCFKHFKSVPEALGALELCNKTEYKLPNMIFLDLHLPIYDGWSFLEATRTNSCWETSSLYVLTNSASPEDIRRAKSYPQVTATQFKDSVKSFFKDL
ncbi:CheY chemotaxis protein or a CheY-like REC (receiver) domain [Pustulibacterium marinum]|uniref:CheY chemotaxis protein or a CheY-like REC (Receiver) domain n=1 Tax=Pustulibacterium marinum TaxID=1224947 RepID=A0A1I7IN04_9FLAO|nr:response regulator [Pustulibacterium marinum]SFU74299.1 CheY chemotaxis protein or a CheY-like REC (receiver) domain [Pustulibacterium marinum]